MPCGLEGRDNCFWRNILHPSSGLKQYVPVKHWCLPTCLHIVTTQKTKTDMIISVVINTGHRLGSRNMVCCHVGHMWQMISTLYGPDLEHKTK
jgi:hypothetical protein